MREPSYRLPLVFDSMDGKITLRRKVHKAREAVVQERQNLARLMVREAEGSARLAISLVAQAGEVAEAPGTARPLWGSLGPAQGNLERHIDCLAGQIEVLDEVISLLDQVLRKEPT